MNFVRVFLCSIRIVGREITNCLLTVIRTYLKRNVIFQIMSSALVLSTCRRVPSSLVVFCRTAATAPKAAAPVTPESLINEQRPQSKESKEHQKTKTSQLQPTESTKVDKKARTSNSFVMNLFRGQFSPNEVFPYPNVLTEEQKENVKMLIDPISKFFQEKNDPAKNDQLETVFHRILIFILHVR